MSQRCTITDNITSETATDKYIPVHKETLCSHILVHEPVTSVYIVHTHAAEYLQEEEEGGI